jgi:hypothetical protein
MTKIAAGQPCPACGNTLVIPQLATGVIYPAADYVCAACGLCYSWSDAHPPTLRRIDHSVTRIGDHDVPQPVLQKG